MEAGDFVLNFRKFEPVQLGSQVFMLTDKEWPVYVGNVVVRSLVLQPLSQPEMPNFSAPTFDPSMRFLLSAEQRRRILLAVPREAWDWQNTPSEPFDLDLAKGN